MKRLLLLLVTCGLFTITTHAQTGIAVPDMKKADSLIKDFMATWGIDGGVAAISYKGKLIYNRGFGYADQDSGEVTQPYNLFRIASVSKPITSIAVMMLLQDSLLYLTDTVFGTGRIIDDNYYLGVINDNRIYNITVQQLLEHTAGWDRSVPCDGYSGCDPIEFPLHVTQSLGESNPVTDSAMIKFLLKKGLNFDPGTKYAYSNIGYLVLGKVIEHVSGMSYEQYVKSKIFEPLGLCDIQPAHSLLKDKLEREAEYNATGTTLSCFDSSTVPIQYGGLNIEAMLAHGGWAATAHDLVRLIVAVDTFPSVKDILDSTRTSIMSTPSSVNSHYAKGWSVNSAYNWWHTGSLPGTATFIARAQNQYAWAFLFNNRSTASSAFWSAFDDLPWYCISGITAPSHDLFGPEGTNATNIKAVRINPIVTTAHITWDVGGGNKRIIVVSSDTANYYPIDGVDYNANSKYGMGSSLGPNHYVVYDGVGTQVTVTNIDSRDFWVTSFEYDKNAATGNKPIYKMGCRERFHIWYLEGVENVSAYKTATIAPNPANNEIRITGIDKAKATVAVFDLTGKLVLEQDIEGNATVNISRLTKGMYVLRLTGENIVQSQKLIKL